MLRMLSTQYTLNNVAIRINTTAKLAPTYTTGLSLCYRLWVMTVIWRVGGCGGGGWVMHLVKSDMICSSINLRIDIM